MDMNESKLMTNAAFIFPKSPEVKEELYEASYFLFLFNHNFVII